MSLAVVGTTPQGTAGAVDAATYGVGKDGVKQITTQSKLIAVTDRLYFAGWGVFGVEGDPERNVPGILAGLGPQVDGLPLEVATRTIADAVALRLAPVLTGRQGSCGFVFDHTGVCVFRVLHDGVRQCERAYSPGIYVSHGAPLVRELIPRALPMLPHLSLHGVGRSRTGGTSSSRPAHPSPQQARYSPPASSPCGPASPWNTGRGISSSRC